MDKLTDDKDSNPLLPTKTTVEASNEKVDEVAQSGYTLESILFPFSTPENFSLSHIPLSLAKKNT